ncbi:MAG: hypothetical protein O3C21_03995 [Verrucomicrobia bacterium]|nr:hypothetical protein [Verrucomicrobiota bacterium]
MGFVAIFLAQWYSTPAGVQWVAMGGAERSDTDSGTLFLYKRIVPKVREHYVSRIEDWGAIIKSELELAPQRLPSLYFFYDRATYEKYSKEADPSIRAFYTSETHSVYTHGSFDVGGQTTNLDEEGTLVHESLRMQ